MCVRTFCVYSVIKEWKFRGIVLVKTASLHYSAPMHKNSRERIVSLLRIFTRYRDFRNTGVFLKYGRLSIYS